MKYKKHGLSIGIERFDSDFFVSLKAVGTLSHADYMVITPMIDAALLGFKEAKIKMLFDASELAGWELRAAWDDFKLGLAHGSEFEKIAIYGHKNWLHLGAKLGNWFINGRIEYFEQEAQAVAWLNDDKQV
jgi:hypothetical protein